MVNFTTSTNGYWLKQCCKERKESCKDTQPMPQMAQSPNCPTHPGPGRPLQDC